MANDQTVEALIGLAGFAKITVTASHERFHGCPISRLHMAHLWAHFLDNTRKLMARD